MEKFVSLATDPDFQPFQWSWPGNHQPMHATMIMLIDLYERPYSPEAPKSRAYIDKIFSMTGPDGGVVGGEDGVSTQRPLKDGGREAWDMIRRLRQKAWQKAGLDPHRLWSEQAQIQAGVTSLPEEYANNDPCYTSSSPTAAASPSTYPPPLTTRRQLTDFSKMFYNMTRSHQLPNPATTNNPRPSPLRYQLPPPAPVPILPSPQSRTVPPPFPQSPTPPKYPMDTTTSPLASGSPISSPESIAPLNPNIFASTFNNTPQQASQLPTNTPPPMQAAPPLPSFMDTAISPTSQPITGVPTPPSMVDPNLNFDWDQWDAVFGQHLPVADELMELDPVTGFEFGDLGSAAYASNSPSRMVPGGSSGGGVGRGSFGSVGSGGNEVGMGEVRGSDWVGYC
ncbi:hypothetical protein AlacWU_08084 [Aspergillus niger]|nr:hypothetical protein AlacWU_08084 [Aspergillus niger]